jgi:hypothetical protein
MSIKIGLVVIKIKINIKTLRALLIVKIHIKMNLFNISIEIN